MAYSSPPRAALAFSHLLACPTCHGSLHETHSGLTCPSCRIDYPVDPSTSQPDLRLRTAKDHVLHYTPGLLAPSRAIYEGFVAPIPSRPPYPAAIAPELCQGNRLTEDLLQSLPLATSAHQWMLDLGCGKRMFEPFCKDYTGFQYLGADFSGGDAHLLVDAHGLPFPDESFDFVLSIAVFEHLTHPDIAASEIFRILKPGGWLIGTVAFLEPFHMDSHFHMTHLGIARVAGQAGFDRIGVVANRDWSALQALAEMALLKGLPPPLQRLAIAPTQWAGDAVKWLKAWRKGVPTGEQCPRPQETTGGFAFQAGKPAGSSGSADVGSLN